MVEGFKEMGVTCTRDDLAMQGPVVVLEAITRLALTDQVSGGLVPSPRKAWMRGRKVDSRRSMASIIAR